MSWPRRSLAAMLLVTLTTGCSSRSAGEAQEKPAGEDSRIHVQVATAQRRTLTGRVFGLGRSEAVPGRRAAITATVQDEIVRLLVQPGQRVKAGQPLLELRGAVARATLAGKIADRAALDAALHLLKAPPRPEEQKNHELAVTDAQLAVDKAQAAVRRLRPLRARNEIPEQQMYEAELALRQAEVRVESATLDLKVLMLGPRVEAVAEAQAKIAAAQQAVTAAQADLDARTIRATIDGTVDRLTCRLGDTPAVGTVLGEVVDVSQLWATVWLAVRDVQRVRLGLAVQINPVDASRPGQSSWEFDERAIAGRVVVIGRVVDSQTGNIPVEVLVENQAGRLALEQSLAAAITVEERRNVLVVPDAAIHDLGEGPVLSVIRAGKSALLHPQLGLEDRPWVEVSGTDLEPGESVIVAGGYNLPDGTAVTVDADQPAAAAGSVSAKGSP